MAAPTFVTEAETTDWSSSSNKSAGPVSVVVGDILIAKASTGGWTGTNRLATPTNTGTALTWTLQHRVAVTDYTELAAWTAPATVTESISVNFSTGNNVAYGASVEVWRDSDGGGASPVKANANNNSSEVSITTAQANSAISWILGDWAAVTTSRTYFANAGAFTERVYATPAGVQTVYSGYHADAGAAAAYAVGVDTPDGMKWAIVAVEIKGTASAAAVKRLTFLGVGD